MKTNFCDRSNCRGSLRSCRTVLFLSILLCAVPDDGVRAQETEKKLFADPMQLHANGAPIDVERNGGAAPTIADLDGDGVQDLLVGQAGGALRIYRNSGTNKNPRYGEFTWFQNGEDAGRVPNNHGFNPRVVDINRDGRLDILSPAWHGKVYCFLQSGEKSFAAGSPIKNIRGQIIQLEWTWGVASCDWESDGDLDLIVGFANYRADQANLALLRNSGESEQGMPLFENPELLTTTFGSLRVQTNGPMPEVADWNGDGLFDLIVKHHEGDIVWFQNTGSPSAPKFGRPAPLVAGEDVKGEGGNISVQDYNGDGKLDLLVGANGARFERKLAPEETARKELLGEQIDAVHKRWGNAFRLYRRTRKSSGSTENTTMLLAVKNQLSRLTEELKTYRASIAQLSEGQQTHSFVWVYLRN